MSKVIEDIFYGKFYISEMEAPHTEKYKNALAKNEKAVEKITSIMKKHDIDNADQLVNDVFDSIVELDNCTAIDIFKAGIKLGLAVGELK